jgi:hypothetical protein
MSRRADICARRVETRKRNNPPFWGGSLIRQAGDHLFVAVQIIPDNLPLVKTEIVISVIGGAMPVTHHPLKRD